MEWWYWSSKKAKLFRSVNYRLYFNQTHIRLHIFCAVYLCLLRVSYFKKPVFVQNISEHNSAQGHRLMFIPRSVDRMFSIVFQCAGEIFQQSGEVLCKCSTSNPGWQLRPTPYRRANAACKKPDIQWLHWFGKRWQVREITLLQTNIDVDNSPCVDYFPRQTVGCPHFFACFPWGIYSTPIFTRTHVPGPSLISQIVYRNIPCRRHGLLENLPSGHLT